MSKEVVLLLKGPVSLFFPATISFLSQLFVSTSAWKRSSGWSRFNLSKQTNIKLRKFKEEKELHAVDLNRLWLEVRVGVGST